MAKIKLELKLQNDPQLRDLATSHKNALASPPGSTQFPTPQPTPAVYDAALAAFAAKLTEIELAEAHLGGLRSTRDQLRAALESLVNQRAAYVQGTSGGDGAMIQNAGFSLQSERAPTTSLATPVNLATSIGVNAGEIKVTCKAVPKAKSYIWECRTYDDNAVPGAWSLVKVTVKAAVLVTGLASGKKFAFRVRAVGPNDVESSWSDEVVEMAR